MYKSGNKHTAIRSFSPIICKFANAINELGVIADLYIIKLIQLVEITNR
jgi:hypothetical protein